MEAVVAAKDQQGDIESGQFYLRTGMGRKATGSFYTPHEFVRFLVRETLDPKIAALGPPDDPHPARLLTLKIVDPATGSGHFLVEACRHLGEALLTACRLCDERGLHDRIAALPDPDETIAAYLPSRGFSEPRARAICRRLVAVHCLYGCDRNKLAVELAKLSLWLEVLRRGAAADLPGSSVGARRRADRAIFRFAFDAAGNGRPPRSAAGRRCRRPSGRQLTVGPAAGHDAERIDRPGHH